VSGLSVSPTNGTTGISDMIGGLLVGSSWNF
jgi:hypothetical protein